MNLEEGINKIFEGNCMLFLGSGFSLGSVNVNRKNLMSAGCLCEKLDSMSGGDSEGSLENAAEEFIDNLGELKLVEFLKTEFTVVRYTHEQEIIGNCKWGRVYTTNYDDTMEKIAQDSGRVLTPVTLSSPTYEYRDKSDTVIHLNGSVSNLTSMSLSEEFKLTSSSYLTQSFLKSEWISLFRYDLKDCDAIFFVGCSLEYDLDIKRLISEYPGLKDKTFFIVSEYEKGSRLKIMERFGTPLTIGVDGFAKKIKEQKTLYTPLAIKLEKPYLCFNRISTISKRPKIQDDAIWDLFFKGLTNLDILKFSYQYSPDYLYYIHRGYLDKAVELINNGQRNVLVHSDLGNGKTLFILGLSLELSRLGYDVYLYDHYDVSLNREIERICKIDNNRVVIVVENYSSNKELFDILKTYRNNQILIVSDRTVNNDMVYDWLVDMMKVQFFSFDLNVLTDEEIEQIIEIFEAYGLWSHLSARNHYEKKNYIVYDCRRSFRNLLLGLLKSPTIISRFNSIIDTIKEKNNFYEALVLILVSKVFDLNMDLDMLSDAIDDTLIGNQMFKRNKIVKEFIDFDSFQLKVKSSILAEVILDKVVDGSIIKKVMVKTFVNFDRKRFNPNYRKVLRSLLSYTNLQRVLNNNDPKYKSVIVEFFEDVRQCAFCKNNPHYWLQYAIVKLDDRDFPLAETFFKNAYSYAAKKDSFDTYQIDNHYARFLLENEINGGDDRFCMDVFLKAHHILMDTKHDKDTKYYPFRVARNYKPFFTRFYKNMTRKNKEVFVHSCEEMLEMIERYYKAAPPYANRKDVRIAKNDLEQIVAATTINGD